MLQIFNYLDSRNNALFHTVHPECAVFIINAGTYRHVFTLFLQVVTHDITKQSVLFLRYSGACDQICMLYRLAVANKSTKELFHNLTVSRLNTSRNYYSFYLRYCASSYTLAFVISAASSFSRSGCSEPPSASFPAASTCSSLSDIH